MVGMAQVLEAPPVGLLIRKENPALEDMLETEGYVDGPFAGRQQHILVEAADTSYTPPPDPSRPGERRWFWAAADVPVMDGSTILAPDFFLALDQKPPSDPDEKSYHLEHRTAPDLMVEHVSNTRGHELDTKKKVYASWGCRHYVVFDPEQRIGDRTLYVFTLVDGQYVATRGAYFPSLGVGVTLWTTPGGEPQGTFLRLCDESGAVLMTGNERADKERARADRERAQADRERAQAGRERARADHERARADHERARAEQERIRAEQAEARLKQAESEAMAEAERTKSEMEALRAMLRKLGVGGM
jgi:hypothetical protein